MSGESVVCSTYVSENAAEIRLLKRLVARDTHLTENLAMGESADDAYTQPVLIFTNLFWLLLLLLYNYWLLCLEYY